MASPQYVGNDYQDSFGSYRLAFVSGQSIASTGNAVVSLPILGGGIGSPFGGGSYIIRRITVTNPSNTAGGSVPSMATANVTILTTSDGNTSNAVTTAVGQTIGNVTAANTWQDLTLIAAAATSAYTAPVLFVKVGVAVANSAVNISVWGDVVSL
jgi:hypothetical protein